MTDTERTGNRSLIIKLNLMKGRGRKDSASMSEKEDAESKKRKRGDKKTEEQQGRKGAEGGKKKSKVEVAPEAELSELPPAFAKVASPQASRNVGMSPGSGALTLKKLQKSFLDTTLREQVHSYVPSELRYLRSDGVVEVPLGYIDIEDLVVKGEKINLNPRQLNAEGVDRIRQRFRINGYDSDKSILTGVLTVSPKNKFSS